MLARAFAFLTGVSTSAPAAGEGTGVVKEAFNLSQHIHDNIWAYGAVAVVAVFGTIVYFVKKKSDREDGLARKKNK